MERKSSESSIVSCGSADATGAERKDLGRIGKQERKRHTCVSEGGRWAGIVEVAAVADL